MGRGLVLRPKKVERCCALGGSRLGSERTADGNSADNGKGGDRSILRTITVSSVMVDRVVGDQYEWRDRSYREFTPAFNAHRSSDGGSPEGATVRPLWSESRSAMRYRA